MAPALYGMIIGAAFFVFTRLMPQPLGSYRLLGPPQCAVLVARSDMLAPDRPAVCERRAHVARERKAAKFWLEPVRLEYNRGFAQNELSKIAALVQEHQAMLLKAWHDYFKSGNGNGDG